MSICRSLLLCTAACVLAGTSVIGCADTPAYNPDNLGVAQYTKVTDICRNVMGLSPAERLAGGNWLGNSRLDYWTSYYRGCVLSLSDSLSRSIDAGIVQQADADCRSKGYRSGTPDLALCVLNTANARAGAPQPQDDLAAATPVSETVPPAGTFFRASPRETARRQQLACAALGLDPADAAFNRCVKALGDTFYSIGHPIN